MAAADVLPIDVYRSNAYSTDVKFDLTPRLGSPVTGATDIEPEEPTQEPVITVNPEVSVRSVPSRAWDVDIRSHISTKKWLVTYGLKKNRLDIHHLLPIIGFKHANDYDKTLKKPVCSRYGSDIFQRYLRSDGKTFNLACTKDQLKQIEARLMQAISMYKRRLEWLTSESRRIFGVIEEKSVTLVIDIRNMSPQQFNQYKCALERVVREQVSNIAKFNMIRATEDMVCYAQECVPVTADSIESAVEWIWKLERTDAVSKTSTCEAVFRAINDHQTEAVYLFTEGKAIEGGREILKEKLTGVRLPVHVVSYNCTDGDTVSFLKEVTRITGGRFHAYAVVMEMDAYEGLPVDKSTNQANIILKKKTYGGIPPGAGTRDDVIELFEELEQARYTLTQIQALLDEYPDSKNQYEIMREKQKPRGGDETYMSSREWLEKHGLKSRKLGFYDILGSVAFKHQDGVVDLLHAPVMEYQTDAISRQKLVNARYCDKFPHVRWKDGEVVHVQVTPEIHRMYEAKVRLALETFQARIDWLQQGSRELFGTVIESKVYFLIDTSASMSSNMQFVKDKLFSLMQEQLRHKQKVNFIAYDSRAHPWKDQLVEVNEKNLQSAWAWVKNLMCKGSTNTLAALRHALADDQTQAIYLLTDGRPDQPPKSVLAQVFLHPNVPIHTISFNCADREANEFLCQLAKDTGGRFHYYSENGVDPDGPEPWESEDIRMLRHELELGIKNLEKIAQLRDECIALSYRKDEWNKKCTRNHHMSDADRVSAVPALHPHSIYRVDRPRSAPNQRPRFTPAPPSPPGSRPGSAKVSTNKARTVSFTRSKSSQSILSSRSNTYRSSPRSRPQSAMSPVLAALNLSTTGNEILDSLKLGRPMPRRAGHTRTSILRTLGSSGHFELQETQALFESQSARQQRLIQLEMSKHKKKTKKKRKSTVYKGDWSSRRWLSKHGLSALKLTLIDVLSPTFIPHKAKYVPIIDKRVMSKVFDDILPYGHVRKSTTSMNIVNPQGVDLERFISRVEQAIDRYKRRLNKIVWEFLPNNEKRRLHAVYDDDDLKEKDEDEEKKDDEKEKENSDEGEQEKKDEGDEKEDNKYEKSADNNKAYLTMQLDFLANRTAIMAALDRCGWPLPETDVVLLETEIHQGEVYIQQAKDLMNNGTYKQGEDHVETQISIKEMDNQSVMSAASNVKRRVSLEVLRSQTVIGRFEKDGFYYPGVVVKCPTMRTALVDFDNLGRHLLPTRFCIPITGAVARPILQIGDYALAKVINDVTGYECYVPGIVYMTPRELERQAKFYTLILFNGQKDHFLRNHLVLISKLRYTFIVRYIASINMEEIVVPTTPRPRSKSPEIEVRFEGLGEEYDKLDGWRRELEDQYRKQRRYQKKLKEQAKQLAHLRLHLTEGHHHHHGDHHHHHSDQDEHQLLHSLLEKMEKAKHDKTPRTGRSTHRSTHRSQPSARHSPSRSPPPSARRPKTPSTARSRSPSRSPSPATKVRSPSLGDRTEEWVVGHNHSSDGPSQVDERDKDQLLRAATDKGVVIAHDRSNVVSPVILEMRSSLPALNEGEEILARWSDEGWYYSGVIQHDCGDNSYIVEDGVGDLEKIWREDIIADQDDDRNARLRAKDPVVGLHPDFCFSYAPGVVLDTGHEIKVRFYDGSEAHLPRTEVYRMPAEKFESDVEYILQCEDQWVGQVVVARNDKTGIYQLATVSERVGNGRQYRIEFSDGASTVQASTFIFGAFTKKHPLAIGDHILAIADSKCSYLPGQIKGTNRDKLEVKFCDGYVSKSIDPAQCFWLSGDYYDTAVKYYKSHKSSKSRSGTTSYTGTDTEST